jgi:hypothetical protein
VSLRRLTTPVFVLLVLAASACTGGDDPGPSPRDPGTDPTEPTGSALPTEDPGAVRFAPGLFRYTFNSVSAELRWQGGEGELIVDNGSDRELDEPGLYAVTSDQREVPADVAEARPIGVGDSATFTISFPDDVAFEQTGFVVLLFGDENWGAFAPVPEEEA